MAGSSAGSIFVDLLLRDANYVAGLNRARNSTRQFGSQASRDLAGASNAFRDVLNPVDSISASLRNLAGIAAGALSVSELVRYSDTWKQLQGRLLIVEGSMEAVSEAQMELSNIADRTRQPLEGITSFYARLKQFIPEAERAQYDLLGVTESVSTALAITGETSASASAAMIQFTQAIGTNFEAAGQELRSLQEQAPRLTQALMNALGDGTKSLQQLKEEGVLTRETVLNALGGMGEEGRRLAEELAKVPVTVGQAFVQLDNAFLEYIGTSEAVTAGTSSLSVVIQTLAQNIDFVAKALVGLAFIMTSRVVVSFIAANSQALAYQLTLARMAGVSSLAATSLLGLSAASRGLGLALAALGGPVGIAVIAVVTALTLHSNKAVEAQARYTEALGLTSQGFINFANQSEEAKNKILEDVDTRIRSINRERNEVEKLVLAYASLDEGNVLDALGTGVLEGLGKLGIGTAPSEAIAQYEAATKALERLQKERRDALKDDGVSNAPPVPVSKEGKKLQDELNKLLEKNRDLISGIDKETLDYMDTEKELQRLYNERKITYDELYTALSNLDEKYDETTEKANIFGIDTEEFGKRAASNIQDAFADFLFDPFADGLDGMAKGFVDTVRKMIAEAQAAQLAKYLFGELGGGSEGSGGGLLGSIFGGLSGSFGNLFGSSGASSSFSSSALRGATTPKPQFFADGGYLGPGQFGIAGEEGAELLYGGRTGVSVFNQDQISGKGNTYNIDAKGADMGALRRIEGALLALAGPGVIEQRVINAQTRGAI